LCVANLSEIGAVLATITDDASADAALAKLNQAIARQEALVKKMESYNLSKEDHLKLAKDRYQQYLSAHSDMTVSTVTTRSNLAYARSKAPGRAKEIEAAMKKIGLAYVGGRTRPCCIPRRAGYDRTAVTLSPGIPRLEG
jgi:hypothetical protein